MQDRKMQDSKMEDSKMEDRKCRGGKCRTGKCGTIFTSWIELKLQSQENTHKTMSIGVRHNGHPFPIS